MIRGLKPRRAARGWAWLVYDHDWNLLTTAVGDSQNTYPYWNATPILALDVYEHAYFLDYGRARAKYIDAPLRTQAAAGRAGCSGVRDRSSAQASQRLLPKSGGGRDRLVSLRRSPEPAGDDFRFPVATRRPHDAALVPEGAATVQGSVRWRTASSEGSNALSGAGTIAGSPRRRLAD